MKLHTVMVTYNRLELTKRAIASYLETVTVPFTLIVVDNHSTDGTVEWLRPQSDILGVLALPENRYPGYACNRGWELAVPSASFFQRCDNDFAFLPGWCERVQEMFVMQKIGQVGLRTDAEEQYTMKNTGGNCVIRRELWDQGLRWDERPWSEFPPLCTEDTFFSPQVRRMGWTWKRVREPCIVPLASGNLGDSYYQESYAARGIDDPSPFRQKLGIQE